MFGKSTDAAWEKFGDRNPYFGVVTDDKYRRENLTEEGKAEFFRTGEAHVAEVLGKIRHRIDPAFTPARTLDFGCGVGRLTRALADMSPQVVGVDVSESMLALAREHCRERAGVSFVKSDDALSRVTGTFDFIHTFIVLQHIPPGRGTGIFQELYARLSPGGVGVMHVTYARRTGRAAWRTALRAWTPPVARKLVGLARGRFTGLFEPEMQMNEYDLNKLLHFLQRGGVRDVFLDFTDHGVYGAVLYFRKPS